MPFRIPAIPATGNVSCRSFLPNLQAENQGSLQFLQALVLGILQELASGLLP